MTGSMGWLLVRLPLTFCHRRHLNGFRTNERRCALMDLSSINPILLLASLMVAATPILLAAIGELVVERAGVLNLGVEGMMITGAVCGFVVAVATSSPWLGFLGAANRAKLL